MIFFVSNLSLSFNFLLEDKCFLNLLFIDRPQELVTGAVCVLETNFMGTTYMESYKDKSLAIIHRLTDLMTAPQGFWIWKNVNYKEFKKRQILIFFVVVYFTF